MEDDHQLRDLLARGLRAHSFDVVSAVDGESALRSARVPLDAVVMDIGLPDSDGRDVCQALRSRGVDVPVIFLTARHDLSDRLSGGDDYLAKPFALAELIARLNALLRRQLLTSTGGGDDRLVMDPVAHRVRYNEAWAELSPIEYRLLARLAADPAAIVRRSQLRAAGWPAGAIVADNTLDQYVRKLRRKLADVSTEHVIRLVRGIGYQLTVTDAGRSDTAESLDAEIDSKRTGRATLS